NQDHARAVVHTYEVELSIATARRLIEQAEASRRGYLLTANREYRTAYYRWADEMPGAVARLATLTQDNPNQRANLARLRQMLAVLFAART
ncbi:CHASE3 domain-containing protein, partial [Enterococcus faecalis]|uniref:CHASE3 domain-containing protein n=3 Tax=Bacteria TaxID=2 RepID=UPI003D6BFD49